MSSKPRGKAKNETLLEKLGKAKEKKEAAQKRQKKAGVEPPSLKPSTTPKVGKNAVDKKMARFLGHARTNRDHQLEQKKSLREKMRKKLQELNQKKDDDEDDDEDEGEEGDEAEGDEEVDVEDEEEKEEEAAALRESAAVLEKDGTEVTTEIKLPEVRPEVREDTSSMEELKKKFSGKRVQTPEEKAADEAREKRIDELVKRRAAEDREHIEERQIKQKARQKNKRRKLQGNQRTRVGPNYMPFLSVGF